MTNQNSFGVSLKSINTSKHTNIQTVTHDSPDTHLFISKTYPNLLCSRQTNRINVWFDTTCNAPELHLLRYCPLWPIAVRFCALVPALHRRSYPNLLCFRQTNRINVCFDTTCNARELRPQRYCPLWPTAAQFYPLISALTRRSPILGLLYLEHA